MLKKYADDIRNKMEEKNTILSDHKKRIDDLEDENIKLLKKDLDKKKRKNKPQAKHTHPRSKMENVEDNNYKLYYY